jgi:GAF domain-containing protein
MADHVALNRTLVEFTQTLLARYDIGHVLYRLTDHTTEILGVAGAGVSLAEPDGSLRFVTATDDAASRIEDHQVRSRQGPCHEAYRTAQQVLVGDLDSEGRWPDYVEVARKVGFESVAGLPLRVEDRAVGALNVYHTEPHDWPPDDVTTAQILADMAAGYILNVRELEETRRLADQLQSALDSRIVIEQAKGIIAARSDVDINDAFQTLRTYARTRRRRIHDVARHVIEGKLEL